MKRSLLYAFVLAVLTIALITGCATVLPPEFGPGGRERELPGPILALAGEGDLVVAANLKGFHLRGEDGTWRMWEVPGISNYRQVTTLAVRSGEICVGTDGEGLHIYKDGTWEVRTARYGGLPDDRVLSLAYDGSQEGLEGDNLWVGTTEGIAVRRDGTWTVYRPGESWLSDISADEAGGKDKIFIGPGFNLGGRGEDSEYFRPPISAIGVGPDRVVFGNPDSRIAIVAPSGTAAIHFTADAKIMSLRAEKGVIWVGTNGGLVWGGLEGEAQGTPWPHYRADAAWTGRLFGTRNSLPFKYQWHVVGYNLTTVTSLIRDADSLWVVYGKPDSKNPPRLAGEGEENIALNPDVRRYINIEDYIARKDPFVYEKYGKNVGISGFPTAVLPMTDRGELWVGTTKGLYRLER